MPNFDEFERLIRKAMTEPDYGLQGVTPRLAAVPRQNRPRLFKGRTQPELEMWVQRARQKLAEMFGAESNFRTSDLNIKGSDLTVIGTGKEIELKTGGHRCQHRPVGSGLDDGGRGRDGTALHNVRPYGEPTPTGAVRRP